MIPDYYPELGLSRKELLDKVASKMSEYRFRHVLGVEAAAIDLAVKNSVDPYQAGLAGLLHDYAKEVSDQVYLDLIDRLDLNPELKKWGNNVWHGMVGRYIIAQSWMLLKCIQLGEPI